MKPPRDIKTPVVPVNFGVEDNDMNEFEQPRAAATGNGSAESDASPYDMQALVDGFRKLPVEEQTHRLLMLYLANQGDDGTTRKLLADHKLEDNQEFAVINDELGYLSECFNLIMKHLGIEPPPRPKDRPRRKAE